MIIAFKIFLRAWFKTIMRRVIFEEAVIVGAVTIFQALENNLAWLLLFCLVNLFTGI